MAGASSGLIVLADRQTSGRGRLGRSWQSAPGNLQASFVLRPDCSLSSAGQLSLLAAVALADMLGKQSPDHVDLKLKWPNDMLVDGAKVAGILLESAGDSAGRLTHVILGLGLNIAWCPLNVDYPVTSLRAAGFQEQSPKAWLSAYAISLETWLDRWQKDGFAEIREFWREWGYGLGDPIRLRLDQEDIDGRFLDLTDSGAILIEHADGTRRELMAGDVAFDDR